MFLWCTMFHQNQVFDKEMAHPVEIKAFPKINEQFQEKDTLVSIQEYDTVLPVQEVVTFYNLYIEPFDKLILSLP